MKLKASKREIKENSYYIIGVGYCNADYLLQYTEPFSYCAGVYGWCCDNYQVNTKNHCRVIISTGYSYINNQNIDKNINTYDIIKKYNDKARKIINDYKSGKKWEQKQKAVNKLLYKCIDEIIDYNKKEDV